MLSRQWVFSINMYINVLSDQLQRIYLSSFSNIFNFEIESCHFTVASVTGQLATCRLGNISSRLHDVYLFKLFIRLYLC
jgi:hypothetical protein